MGVSSTRWRQRAWRILAVGLLLALFVGFACEQIGRWQDSQHPFRIGRAVDVGGHSLNINCAGSGSPAVILESGGGGYGGYGWRKVQTEVAKFTTVCWYDRAGEGWSDPAPTARSCSHVMTLRNPSYWHDDRFPGLRDLAVEIPSDAKWAAYGEYCLNRLRGREPALQILDDFIAVFKAAPFSERRSFVSWLMNRVSGFVGGFELPRPLWANLLEPTLLEWIASDPNCSEPHRWIGDDDHLRQALKIDPSDEIARRKLIALTLIAVGEATHELPTGYLGNPEQDLRALDEAEELVAALPEAVRPRFYRDIREERTSITDYLDTRKTAQHTD